MADQKSWMKHIYKAIKMAAEQWRTPSDEQRGSQGFLDFKIFLGLGIPLAQSVK